MIVQDLNNQQISELQAILARVDAIEKREENEVHAIVSPDERGLIVLSRILLQIAPGLSALSPDRE